MSQRQGKHRWLGPVRQTVSAETEQPRKGNTNRKARKDGAKAKLQTANGERQNTTQQTACWHAPTHTRTVGESWRSSGSRSHGHQYTRSTNQAVARKAAKLAPQSVSSVGCNGEHVLLHLLVVVAVETARAHTRTTETVRNVRERVSKSQEEIKAKQVHGRD